MTIFLQFTRVVNVFYVFNAVLQFIPSISTNSPMATIIPLTVIIIFGIVKEAVVELKKWHDDKHINATVFRKLIQGSENHIFSPVEFQDIRVGDIIEIKDEEALPADCILLKTTKASGQVFVETAALDGERNLKPLLVPVEI